MDGTPPADSHSGGGGRDGPRAALGMAADSTGVGRAAMATVRPGTEVLTNLPRK